MASSVCVLSMSLLLLVCGTVLHQTSAENLRNLREAIQLIGGYYDNYEQSQRNPAFDYINWVYYVLDIPALNQMQLHCTKNRKNLKLRWRLAAIFLRPVMYVESINDVRVRACIIFVDDDGSTGFYNITGVTIPLQGSNTLYELDQIVPRLTRDKLETDPLCKGQIKWSGHLELTHNITCYTYPASTANYVLFHTVGDMTATISGTSPEANAGAPYFFNRHLKNFNL